jgi:hypothetical protein
MMWIFAAAMALIVQQGEWLAMPMPEGFFTAHKQQAQVGTIEERIAKGETVEDWTRMVTLIALESPLSIQRYAATFDDRLRSGCPGAVSTAMAYTDLAGHMALASRLDCPLNPQTGKPETLFYSVISVNGRLHMLQVAFRHVPSDDEVEWARKLFDGAVVCDSASANALCQR